MVTASLIVSLLSLFVSLVDLYISRRRTKKLEDRESALEHLVAERNAQQ